MAKKLRSSGALTWVLLAAVICLVVGAIVPPLMENRSRPLSTTEVIDIASEPKQGRMLDVERWLTNQTPRQNLDSPFCNSDQAPMRCYITTPKINLERTTSTSALADDSLAATDTLLTVFVDGKPIAEVNDHVELNRESAYPVADFTSSQTFTVQDLGTGIVASDNQREGLQYFFPSQTEQRSYAYFDQIAQTDSQIDFTGTDTVDGIPVYVFEQRIDGSSIADGLSRAVADTSSDAPGITRTDELKSIGPARNFYNTEERKRYGYTADQQISMEPYYSVQRKLLVEPTTGTVVDLYEGIDIFFAENAEQASEVTKDNKSSERTLIAAEFSYDEASRAAMLDHVRSTVNMIKVVGLIGWVGKVAAIVLLAIAAWMFVRRRDAGASDKADGKADNQPATA